MFVFIEEQIEMFQSDFGVVARYFVNRRKKRPLNFLSKIPKHVDEVLKLLSVVTNDARIYEGWKYSSVLNGEKKEGVKMGEAWIDAIEERGMIKAFYLDGNPIEIIAEKIKKSIDYIKQVLGLSDTETKETKK